MLLLYFLVLYNTPGLWKLYSEKIFTSRPPSPIACAYMANVCPTASQAVQDILRAVTPVIYALQKAHGPKETFVKSYTDWYTCSRQLEWRLLQVFRRLALPAKQAANIGMLHSQAPCPQHTNMILRFFSVSVQFLCQLLIFATPQAYNVITSNIKNESLIMCLFCSRT